MSLAAFPCHDRAISADEMARQIAPKVWRVIVDRGAPCSVYVGNVFVTVKDKADLTDPRLVGTYTERDGFEAVMRAIDEALADLRGGR